MPQLEQVCTVIAFVLVKAVFVFERFVIRRFSERSHPVDGAIKLEKKLNLRKMYFIYIRFVSIFENLTCRTNKYEKLKKFIKLIS